jgi:non-canonical (house-cleaning) NTP pyrophosphatase
MKIVLGSTNEHKLYAVRETCALSGLYAQMYGIPASSGVSAQPLGFEETHSGAMARALVARSEHGCDLAIGIESGVFRFALSPVTLDIAVIVLITGENKIIVTSSNGIQFPEDCVEEAYRRGFKTTTVGSVIAERHGGDPTDPQLTLTNGKISRISTLVDALKIAFEQL